MATEQSSAAKQHEVVPTEEYERLRLIEAKAMDVIDLYPTVAGTASLIKNANTHVPRNPWDNVADAVYNLSRAVAS